MEGGREGRGGERTYRRVMQRHPPLREREERREETSHRPIRYSEDLGSRGRVSSAATWKKNTSRDGPEKSLSRGKREIYGGCRKV